ncbi:hypothetical protein J6590_094221, partial [Homalodisca vitripennis]
TERSNGVLDVKMAATVPPLAATERERVMLRSVTQKESYFLLKKYIHRPPKEVVTSTRSDSNLSLARLDSH